jgi:hypothetical protein
MEIRQIDLGIMRIASIAVILAACAGCRVSSNEPDPPRVAGQQVPKESIELDFNGRFDLHTNLGKDGIVFKNCRFVGFLAGDEETSFEGKFGKLMHSTRDWLVIEQANGRRVYIPGGTIIYFEDAGRDAGAEK